MEQSSKFVPVRTCIICRKRFPKAELERLNQAPGGKGRYVCGDALCRAKAASVKIK